MLTRKFRVQRGGGIAVHAVAGGTGAGLGLACFRIAGFDRTGVHGKDGCRHGSCRGIGRSDLGICRGNSLLGNGASEYQSGAQDEDVGELH